MDPKHQGNYLKKYDEKSLEKLQSKVIFVDPSYLFIFKKTEKITAALYLVTDLISDIEPIKWRIRKISVGLVSDTLAFKSLPSTQAKQAVVGLTIIVSEIISLLKIASVANQISSMNTSILQKELALLMESLQNLHLETVTDGALVLPQEFFNVPRQIFSQPTSTNFPPTQVFASKGHYRTSSGIKDNTIQQASKDSSKDIKDTRRDAMLQLLNTGKSLGIKDFAKEIKGCSEKTLQRELLVMVENGVLKKTGERRWSLYSLA